MGGRLRGAEGYFWLCFVTCQASFGHSVTPPCQAVPEAQPTRGPGGPGWRGTAATHPANEDCHKTVLLAATSRCHPAAINGLGAP